MSEIKPLYDRDELLRDLRESVIEVSFTKVNGQNRTMRCTLLKRLLPPSYLSEEAGEREYHQKNPNVLAVWDVDIRNWRSFRVDSVMNAQWIDPQMFT